MPEHDNIHWDPKGSNLIYLLSPARAGSTMLQFMLGSHSQIHSAPEPNIMPPLKYLGYAGSLPAQETFDPINQSLGLREFVDQHSGSEENYLNACRAYAGTLYRKAMVPETRYFLDKTPANVLEWEMLIKIFPNAKYIVLTRHPFAIIDSHARTFFQDDYDLMIQENTQFIQYIPAVARFIRESTSSKMIVCYEQLVENPEAGVREILSYLELDFEPQILDYGKKTRAAGSVGDPKTAATEGRPNASIAWQWTQSFRQDEQKIVKALGLLKDVAEDNLRDYGYPRNELTAPVHTDKPECTPAKPSDAFLFYRWQRSIYFALKSAAKKGPLRKLLEKIRYYCDVLLR